MEEYVPFHRAAVTSRMWLLLSVRLPNILEMQTEILLWFLNVLPYFGAHFAATFCYSVVRRRSLRNAWFSSQSRNYNKRKKKLLYFCDHNADHLHKRNKNEKFPQQIVRHKVKQRKFTFFSLNQKEIIHLCECKWKLSKWYGHNMVIKCLSASQLPSFF